MSKEDFYNTLGVAKGAAEPDIKKAYRKLAMQYHPDRNPGDSGAEKKFKEVQEAYDVLSDPKKRSAYDQFGHAAFQGGSGGFNQSFDMGDIFEGIFGDSGFGDIFGFGGGRGRNVHVVVTIFSIKWSFLLRRRCLVLRWISQFLEQRFVETVMVRALEMRVTSLPVRFAVGQGKYKEAKEF